MCEKGNAQKSVRRAMLKNYQVQWFLMLKITAPTLMCGIFSFVDPRLIWPDIVKHLLIDKFFLKEILLSYVLFSYGEYFR